MGTGRRTCLPSLNVKGSRYLPDEIMALPFYPVAYPFLRDKRQSTRIYGYAYRCFTRTRKRHILRSLVTRNQRPAEIGLLVTIGFIYGRGEIVSDFTAGRRCILIVLYTVLRFVT